MRPDWLGGGVGIDGRNTATHCNRIWRSFGANKTALGGAASPLPSWRTIRQSLPPLRYQNTKSSSSCDVLARNPDFFTERFPAASSSSTLGLAMKCCPSRIVRICGHGRVMAHPLLFLSRGFFNPLPKSCEDIFLHEPHVTQDQSQSFQNNPPLRAASFCCGVCEMHSAIECPHMNRWGSSLPYTAPPYWMRPFGRATMDSRFSCRAFLIFYSTIIKATLPPPSSIHSVSAIFSNRLCRGKYPSTGLEYLARVFTTTVAVID